MMKRKTLENRSLMHWAGYLFCVAFLGYAHLGCSTESLDERAKPGLSEDRESHQTEKNTDANSEHSSNAVTQISDSEKNKSAPSRSEQVIRSEDFYANPEATIAVNQAGGATRLCTETEFISSIGSSTESPVVLPCPKDDCNDKYPQDWCASFRSVFRWRNVDTGTYVYNYFSLTRCTKVTGNVVKCGTDEFDLAHWQQDLPYPLFEAPDGSEPLPPDLGDAYLEVMRYSNELGTKFVYVTKTGLDEVLARAGFTKKSVAPFVLLPFYAGSEKNLLLASLLWFKGDELEEIKWDTSPPTECEIKVDSLTRSQTLDLSACLQKDPLLGGAVGLVFPLPNLPIYKSIGGL